MLKYLMPSNIYDIPKIYQWTGFIVVFMQTIVTLYKLGELF